MNKFELILKAYNRHPERLHISKLCAIAGVSRSGFYSWYSRDSKQEERDRKTLKLIEKYFFKHNQKIGLRPLKMYIERNENIQINLKRIQRIKKKNNLITQKRKKYKPKINWVKATEHKIAPNLLDQSFKVDLPDKVYSTDVTFLKNKNGSNAYLSSVKDLCTKEIVGYKVSKKNDIDLVIESIKKAIPKSYEGLLIHSDQGHQYTSYDYNYFLKQRGITQSMSRRGNCLDNSPIESFFGHMKDEMDYRSWKDIKDLENRVKEYIKFYNEKRPQWDLKRKTPVEYRSFLKYKGGTF